MDQHTIEWIQKLEKQVDDLTKENERLKKKLDYIDNNMYDEHMDDYEHVFSICPTCNECE